jgi:hypothetical protein
MTPPEVQTPDGNRAFAEQSKVNIVSLPVAQKRGNPKTGRTRYLRLFPERAYYIVEHLNEREFIAFMRLSLAYVVADGSLPADDKKLALITKMGRHWSGLRDKLIALGLGRVEAGFWVDDDQLTNILIQRRLSDRGVRANAVRWGARNA